MSVGGRTQPDSPTTTRPALAVVLGGAIGASMACYSSYLIDFMPFVLLEAVWAVVAAAGLARAVARAG